MKLDCVEPPTVRAFVDGKEFTDIPEDLFIPPDALEVLLDSFSGPLDLLLYLIKKENIDILDIPIISITNQYLKYIDLMEARKMELAAEYLVMAAMLAEIKSRLMLPSLEDTDDEVDDPRMVLVRKLQAYEEMKYASEKLDNLKRYDRDIFSVTICSPDRDESVHYPELNLSELLSAMQQLLIRVDHTVSHQIKKETLSVNERMAFILSALQNKNWLSFSEVVNHVEGKAGVVVSLLAILELAKKSIIFVIQTDAFSQIYLQANVNE